MKIIVSVLFCLTTSVRSIQVGPGGNGASCNVGSISQGAFLCANGVYDRQSSATLSTGIMSTIQMDPRSSFQQESNSKFSIGAYSLVTLDTNCKLSLNPSATVSRLSGAINDGRTEIYCNNTFTLGSSSSISMQPQSFLNVHASTTIGAKISLKMMQSALLNVQHTLVISDNVKLYMDKQAGLEILPTATGVTQISSKDGGQPTMVTLFPSAKIESEGEMTIGGGQSTNVNLMKSGLLQIGPQGSFTIKSSTFTIGPSSFWIINGDFSFDEGSSLSSDLQSNITVIPASSTQKGVFKTLTGGTVFVGAGATMALSGTTQVTGILHLDASAHMSVTGTLSLTTKAVSKFILNYAATASIEGSLTIGGSITLGASAGMDVGQGVNFNNGHALSLGERAQLNFVGPLVCIQFYPLSIPAYQNVTIASSADAQKYHLICQ